MLSEASRTLREPSGSRMSSFRKRGRPAISPEERFLAKVVEDPESGCWIWQGWIDRHGYGQFTPQHGKKVRSHRWAFEHWCGPIPAGLEIDHLCRVRGCCNPAHLEPVTGIENMRRSPHFPGHKTHCKHGHPLSGENLRVTPQGRRDCRTCAREKQRRLYAVRKEQA